MEATAADSAEQPVHLPEDTRYPARTRAGRASLRVGAFGHVRGGGVGAGAHWALRGDELRGGEAKLRSGDPYGAWGACAAGSAIAGNQGGGDCGHREKRSRTWRNWRR